MWVFTSINEIKISMGYLDNLSLDLSPNLNTIIGGRGAGKSTFIELIRYAVTTNSTIPPIPKLDLQMFSKDVFAFRLIGFMSNIIGGRGAGKSTFIELIRYALDINPMSRNANTSFENICKSNLGIGGIVEWVFIISFYYLKLFTVLCM
jgi:predicted ATPase